MPYTLSGKEGSDILKGPRLWQHRAFEYSVQVLWQSSRTERNVGLDPLCLTYFLHRGSQKLQAEGMSCQYRLWWMLNLRPEGVFDAFPAADGVVGFLIYQNF